jgi:outer membrane protein TolC
VAAARARVAGEAARARLDLTGFLQTQGLGNKQVPPALEQFGTFGAESAQIGMTYQLPLDGSRYRAQRAGAKLATQLEKARREVARQRITLEVRSRVLQAQTAAGRVRLAQRTLRAVNAQLRAAQDRYHAGDGIALEVQQALEQQRRGQLRLARARVDRVTAQLALDHLTGRLLARFARILRTQEAIKGAPGAAHGR